MDPRLGQLLMMAQASGGVAPPAQSGGLGQALAATPGGGLPGSQGPEAGLMLALQQMAQGGQDPIAGMVQQARGGGEGWGSGFNASPYEEPEMMQEAPRQEAQESYRQPAQQGQESTQAPRATDWHTQMAQSLKEFTDPETEEIDVIGKGLAGAHAMQQMGDRRLMDYLQNPNVSAQERSRVASQAAELDQAGLMELINSLGRQ